MAEWKEDLERAFNIINEENKIHLEWAKVYWPQDYEVVDELKKLNEENKKLKEERDFFYKSAKQFREQVEKWEKDFVEWRIVEKE